MSTIQPRPTQVTGRIAPGGRIVLPAAFRHALHLDVGTDVLLRLEGRGIVLTSKAEARKHAQARVMARCKNRPSMAAELIAERRREAQDE